MAKKMQIPEKYQAGIKKVFSLKENEFESLYTTLESATPCFGSKELASQVTQKVKIIKKDEIEDILSSLTSLRKLQDKIAVPTVELVSDVLAALEMIKEFNLSFTDNNRAIFKQRMNKFLNLESLLYPSRSNSLLADHQNVYIRSRIVTDLRPISSPNIEEPPKAGVIVHTLHVHYRYGEESDCKDIYIALDENDIQLLRDELESAEKRAKSFESIFDKAGVMHLRPERNE